MTVKVQLLVFALDDRHYALRLSQTDRVIRAVDAMPLPSAPSIVVGVIDCHGEPVPLLNIRHRFGFPDHCLGANDHFILGRTSYRKVALAVDRVVGIVERDMAEIIPAEKILSHVGRIEGVIQLEDGLVFIHDLDTFLSLDESQTLEQALAGRPSDGE